MKPTPKKIGLSPQQSGSVVYWLRRRLKRKSYNKGCFTIADEIAGVVIDKALDGEFNFVNLLIQKIESHDLTREEAMIQIEQFYNTVRRHVKDQATLANISRDLAQYKERLDGSVSDR